MCCAPLRVGQLLRMFLAAAVMSMDGMRGLVAGQECGVDRPVVYVSSGFAGKEDAIAEWCSIRCAIAWPAGNMSI